MSREARQRSQEQLNRSTILADICNKRVQRDSKLHKGVDQKQDEYERSLLDELEDDCSENENESKSAVHDEVSLLKFGQLNLHNAPKIETIPASVESLQSEPSSASTSYVSVSSGSDEDDVSVAHEASSSERSLNNFAKSLSVGEESSQQGLTLGSGEFTLSARINQMLYPHQVEGVKWLWSLYIAQRGGILGDDMGLGKTMQCAAFLSGMFSSRLMERAIIIAPKTLIAHWEKELRLCGLGKNIYMYCDGTDSERNASLRAVARGPGILLTTYGMVLHNSGKLSNLPVPTNSFFSKTKAKSLNESENSDKKSCFDIMVLDEGHKIKNPRTKLVAALKEISVKVKVIISGTPIQNNLMEMHALFDFCCEGLLGTSRQFKTAYDNVVVRGQDRGASLVDRQRANQVAAQLRRTIDPFFLRREKKEVLRVGEAESSNDSAAQKDADAEKSTGSAAASSNSSAPPGLSRKNDLVIWLRLCPLQSTIYRAFLHSSVVAAALNASESPLAALTALKKICDHPALLNGNATRAVLAGGHKWARRTGPRVSDPVDSADSISSEDDEYNRQVSRLVPNKKGKSKKAAASGDDDEAVEVWQRWAESGGVQAKLLEAVEKGGAESSCKTSFVLALLQELEAKGHRTLIFSQSLVMLNILQAALDARGTRYCRIDGSVDADERRMEVDKFQRTPDIPVFLLTSQVGGLGLTLTAADRVVIVDPSWNPAMDNQSVDRAYRIGQTRDVLVYRLISCGTVEEKIYRRQVFKGGLSKTGTEAGVQFRYFNHTELVDLFKVTDEGLRSSETQLQLNRLHASQRVISEYAREHLTFVMKQDAVAGISDHDLLFTTKMQETTPQDADEGQRIVEAEARALEGTAPRGPNMGQRRQAGGQPLWRAPGWSEPEPLDRSRGLGATPVQGARRLAIEIEQMERERARLVQTLEQMGHRMPDNGRKIQAKVQDISEELARMRAAAVRAANAAAAAEFVDSSPSPSHTAPASQHGESARAFNGSAPTGPSVSSRPPITTGGIDDLINSFAGSVSMTNDGGGRQANHASMGTSSSRSQATAAGAESMDRWLNSMSNQQAQYGTGAGRSQGVSRPPTTAAPASVPGPQTSSHISSNRVPENIKDPSGVATGGSYGWVPRGGMTSEQVPERSTNGTSSSLHTTSTYNMHGGQRQAANATAEPLSTDSSRVATQMRGDKHPPAGADASSSAAVAPPEAPRQKHGLNLQFRRPREQAPVVAADPIDLTDD